MTYDLVPAGQSEISAMVWHAQALKNAEAGQAERLEDLQKQLTKRSSPAINWTAVIIASIIVLLVGYLLKH